MGDRARETSKPRRDDHFLRWRRNVTDFFGGYFWIIFKNVIGWILLLATPVLGAAFPGPGGTLTFLIGFALVTFPGKRRLTSRVMRGRGLPIEMQVFTFVTALLSIGVTCALMYFVSGKVSYLLSQVHVDLHQSTYTAIFAGLVVAGLFALGGTWLAMRLSLQILNYILKGMPLLRRKIRPGLRKRGMIILPSRRKRPMGQNGQAPMQDADEILEIDPRHHRRLRAIGVGLLLWGRRALAVAITIGIFYWILKPIHEHWHEVREPILRTRLTRFVLAAGMFGAFLFAFRALVWRQILSSFGHRLPVAAATRIWSTSEFARYLPGAIWQVVGRVYLVRPYGVTGSVCSITQLLELSIFLLANLLVALGCLLYFGIKNFDGAARGWIYVSAVLAPLLLALLHTKVFYGIINQVMHALGKPAIVRRLRGHTLVGLLFWNIFGLLWQSIAIFVIVQEPLGLIWDWWWVVAGAYCLAWCAGFLAFWAPGGIGVREVVFMLAIHAILPDAVRQTEALEARLAFLSVLLRLWATAGEFILASIAYTLDLRGALGRPDAPGRIDYGATNSQMPIRGSEAESSAIKA